MIIDATCTLADSAFPQDLNLLNKSRYNLGKYAQFIWSN
jgi:hypothetical protein